MPAPLPPPTSNFLDQDERQRLVKSTRKLAGLLGEVPKLVELEDYSRSSSESSSSADSEYSPYQRSQTSLGFNDHPTPRSASRASNRSARVFSSSRASFISFEDLSDSEEEDSPVDLPKALLTLNTAPLNVGSSSKDKLKKSMGPSLYLHLNTTNNSVLNITHSPSPDETKTPVPLSPLSPLSPHIVSGVDRRRQMASKLCRTLGEHVPPELVVAPPTARPHYRSHSNEEVRSKSYFATQQEAVLRQVHQPIPGSRRPSNVYEVVTVEIPSSVAKYYQHDERADVIAALPNSATYSTAGGQARRNPSVRRAGKEWSGEWNHDMQDVMTKLRGLK